MAERMEDTIKRLVVTRLRLKIAPESIGDEQALFGQEGLGLDSIDALELVVGMEEDFKIQIGDVEVDRTVFANVASMSRFVEGKVAAKVAS